MTKRLLIITQKIDKDDSYFGFFHDWVLEFAKHVDVLVIALEVYHYSFPENVKVLSLGKEKGNSRIKYLFNYYKYILTERYDTIFAHMSPWYAILGYPFWNNKKVGLWYVHRNVDAKLWLAHALSDIVFTATKESFGINSKKINYMGQAIDLSKFSTVKKKPSIPTIITVGRITPIKNLTTLIEAVKDINVHVDIVGEAVVYSDIAYKEKLLKLIKKSNLEQKVNFVGAVSNTKIAEWYAKSTMSINLCPTGGLDKAVLESMATHTPVLVSNTAFLPYIEKYKNQLLFSGTEDLKSKIKRLIDQDTTEIENYLFEKVKEKSSLPNLIQNILSKY